MCHIKKKSTTKREKERRRKETRLVFKTRKPRGPNRFRKREARRLFEAGAERVEFDPVTGRLIGYKHAGEMLASRKNSWDEVLANATDQDRSA